MTVDVGSECLRAVLDDETAEKVCRYLKGCRVSFGKHSIEHKEIYQAYIETVQSGTKNSAAIKSLAARFEKSERQIYRIVKKWKAK